MIKCQSECWCRTELCFRTVWMRMSGIRCVLSIVYKQKVIRCMLNVVYKQRVIRCMLNIVYKQRVIRCMVSIVCKQRVVAVRISGKSTFGPLPLHGQLYTARVRSTREGTVFTGVCLLTFRGVTLSQVWGVPNPGMDGEGVPCPRSGVAGGTLSRSGWWGVPHPRGEGYPSQVWMVGRGYPITGGYPGQVFMVEGYLGYPSARPGHGTPSPPWDGVPPIIKTWLGYPPPWDGLPPPPPPSRLNQGTPHHQDLARVPSAWDGVPPTPDVGWGTPPTRQSSIASTCYAAGGMPLAFTHEDFLVFF